jgi:hypothetical protein
VGATEEVTMTDDKHTAWSEGDSARPQVWVCTFQHRHGLDAWVAAGEDAAYASFATTVRSFWREAVEWDRGPWDDDRPPLPDQAPADDRSAVESYFAVMGEAPQPEYFSIERQEVIGDGEH